MVAEAGRVEAVAGDMAAGAEAMVAVVVAGAEAVGVVAEAATGAEIAATAVIVGNLVLCKWRYLL